MSRAKLKRRFCFLLALASIHAASPGFAQPKAATIGGAAADLVPLEDTKLELRNQDVVVDARAGEMRVRARYEFFNPGITDLTLKLAFPEYRCAIDQECTDRPFSGVDISVGEKGVPLEKAPLDDRYPFADYTGVAWEFKLTFPSKKPLRVTLAYTLRPSREINGTRSVSYVTRSGPSFAGSIKRARLALHMPIYTHTVFKPLEGGLRTSGPETVFGDKPRVEISYQGTDWVPDGGIEFSFNASVLLAEARIAQKSNRFSDLFQTTACAYPDIKAEDTERCRDLYRAAKGFPFEQKKERDLYYGGSPDFRLVSAEPAGQLWVRDLRPFEGFNESWFSAEEKKQLHLFEKLMKAADEKQRKAERLAATSNPEAQSCACRVPYGAPGRGFPLASALLLLGFWRRWACPKGGRQR